MLTADLGGLLRRSWWIIVASMCGAVLVGGSFAYFSDPEYTATASIVTSADGGLRDGGGMREAQLMDSRIAEYAAIAEASTFLDRMVTSHGLTMSGPELGRVLTVSSPKSTSLILLSTTGSTRELASYRANAVANELARVIPVREDPIPVRVTVAGRAMPEYATPAKSGLLVTVQWLVVGMTFGFCLVMLRCRWIGHDESGGDSSW